MTDAPIPRPLDGADIAALQHAHTVTFSYSAPAKTAFVRASLGSTVRGYLRALFPEPGTEPRELGRRTIRCGVEIDGYDPDDRYDGVVEWTASDAPHAECTVRVCGPLSPLWSTAARLLQPNDLLTLHWSADVTNESTRNKGLTVDELTLMVQRSGARTMFFSLASSITAPASPDRLIRRNEHLSNLLPRS